MSEDQLVVNNVDQDEGLRFKTLIADISANLGGLSCEDVDREIELGKTMPIRRNAFESLGASTFWQH
jgi:hypothetical protein